MASNEQTASDAPGVELEFQLCKGCGRCVQACPKGVLEMSDHVNSMGYRTASIRDLSVCTGCGMCYYACPEPAGIKVRRRKGKSEKES
ncbi:4Fe-4S binding protein [bacterium]|nr:4Fe-4S binding protein [bacterium]